LFVVMVRTGKGALELVNGEWETPESNLNRARYRHERYPDPAVPVVYLPVSGRWMISQGPDGEHTHQGAWAHAWDFEVDDEKGKKHRNGGTTPDDFYAYDAPVYAPADGKVVRVVDAIEDNPVGEVDTANNWGNLVILWHSGQVYSALCHLKKGSIAVAEGQPVVRGQILGKLGNSGRSPIPHLHYQLQASPEIGAPTLKGEFLHYVVENGHGKQYVTHGVPDLGQEVVPLATDENVRRAVTLAPGREWTWAVSRGAERFEETWESRIDPLGARKIVEKRKRGQAASLSFYADDAYMTALEYEGASRRLLGLLYLGLPRVPFAKDHDLTWSDNLSAAAFLNPAANLLRDLFLPVRELVRMRSHSSMRWAEHGLVVTTHLEINSDLPFTVDRAVPERIEVHCIPDMGPVAIRAYRNDHLICQADLIS
ncbi:M23 family metallopeptidase, partial [bacterium]|nr:M23 family metallopeptidase [bacterium]